MELNKIEGLLDKYDKGTTSLSEEAYLRCYFSKKSIPQHLVPYKQLFFYFESDAKQLAQRSLKVRYKIQICLTNFSFNLNPIGFSYFVFRVTYFGLK